MVFLCRIVPIVQNLLLGGNSRPMVDMRKIYDATNSTDVVGWDI